jgi:hypothetical protein
MKQMARTDPVRKARASLANYCRRCGVSAIALNRGGDVAITDGKVYVSLHPVDGGDPIVARVETKVGHRVTLVSGIERADVSVHGGRNGHAHNGHAHALAQSKLVAEALHVERKAREGIEALDALGGPVSPRLARALAMALDNAIDALVDIEARSHATQ